MFNIRKNPITFIFSLSLSLDKTDHSLLHPFDTPSKNRKEGKEGKK